MHGPNNVYTCGHTVSPNKLEESLGCSFGGSSSGRAEAAKCYFERQKSICMSSDGSRYDRYKSLFETPPMEELEQEFFDIVGDSFTAVPPTMRAAFQQMERISANDPSIKQAKEICDSTLVDSMRLEEIIVTCIFENFEKFCGGVKPDSSGYTSFINNVRWELPEVPWSWDAHPPPPPPTGDRDTKGHYMELDPIGVVTTRDWNRSHVTPMCAYVRECASSARGQEMVRAKLDECFPRLKYVASQSFGSVVGQDTSSNGMG